jgi:hypothetical protein
MRRAFLSVALITFAAAAALAQTAERRLYTMSPEMRRDLEARQFDSGQVEQVVNGVAQGLATGDLKSILDNAGPTIRVTAGKTNTVVKKEKLASFKERLLKDPALRKDVTDEEQFILKGDEVGLARGAFWIDVQCLDDACSKKKSTIATINLP